MAEFEPSDEPETTFRYIPRPAVHIDELITAADSVSLLLPIDADYDATSSAGNNIDFDELDEGEGFWKLNNNTNYNETNTLVEDGTIQTDNPIKLSKYELKIKDTVHQQIFVNSGLLTDLGRDFNCQINFRRKNGNYALFVRPNNTNYMINVTNGISGPDNKERIFFNISLKTGDSNKLIKTEYMSEYEFDNNSIRHMYSINGTPSIIKKNKIDLNKKERLFNPYLILNMLIKNYLKTNDIISMDTSLAIIHSQISNLQKKSLNPTEKASLDRIMKMFETDDEKKSQDKILNGIYKLHQAFLSKNLGHKTIEEIDYKVSYKELYRTNNKFTEILAYRYALFIHDFEFTKSSDGKYIYTDPFPYKLETPFTATDIYLHRFDKHFNHEYAMDRYDINTTEKLHRLADIVELTKSIMMNFISICKKIMNYLE